MKVKVANF